MKGIRHLLRRYLVPTILLGGLVAGTTFYFVNQPQFSGDLVNGVFRMDWGNVDAGGYRSLRTDLSRRVWSFSSWRQVAGSATLPNRNPIFGTPGNRQATGYFIPAIHLQVPAMVGIAGLTVIPLALFAGHSLRRLRRAGQSQCIYCGYSIIGWMSDVCPECGKIRLVKNRHYGSWAFMSIVMLLALLAASSPHWKSPFALIHSTEPMFVTGGKSPIDFGEESARPPRRKFLSQVAQQSCLEKGVSLEAINWLVHGEGPLEERMAHYLDPTEMNSTLTSDPCWSEIIETAQSVNPWATIPTKLIESNNP